MLAAITVRESGQGPLWLQLQPPSSTAELELAEL